MYNKQALVGSFVGYNLLLRDFGRYVIIFINVCCYNRYHYNNFKQILGLMEYLGLYVSVCLYLP
jgi:hypothetical protein